MQPQTQALFEQVMALPEPKRDLLIERMLEVLDPTPEGSIDKEFEAELDRRYEEILRDPSAAIPWSEVERLLDS